MNGVIWCNIFVKSSNDLHLIDDKLRWISDNKILPGKDLFPVLFNPREQEVLGNSIFPINLNQATQSGLENVTVVIIYTPVIDNVLEL